MVRIVGLLLLAWASASLSRPAAAVDGGAILAAPPGTYAGLGTHRLYYHCSGQGAPTVVIDAGLGSSALEWTPVQEALAARTRVCSYDRAGYGWSDPGPSPRTTEQAVVELRAVLAAAGEKPPYILVGHSLGGFNVRYLAARYPQDAAALVLVESSHPQALPELSGKPDGRRHAINTARFERAALPEAPYALAASFLNSRRKAVFAQMDELANFATSAAQVTAAGAIGPLPLVVIARDGSSGEDPLREARWQALQASLVRLSPNGKLVIAEGSDHNVHLERPDVIVAAVSELLSARRLQGRR
ncbi:MAG: alpha/beta fold hydrolase [Gammaproteobacteria bacterium]